MARATVMDDENPLADRDGVLGVREVVMSNTVMRHADLAGQVAAADGDDHRAELADRRVGHGCIVHPGQNRLEEQPATVTGCRASVVMKSSRNTSTPVHQLRGTAPPRPDST